MSRPMKRTHSNSNADSTSKKIRSAKEVVSESRIHADVPEQQTDEKGEPYWELSAKRRVTVSQFKGATLISLREFYEKDGKSLPGKQGISLNLDQFAVLIKAIPAIRASLAVQGVEFEDEDEQTSGKEIEADDNDAASNEDEE